MATFKCDTKYDLISGSPTRTCVGPLWTGSGPAECAIVSCPPLTPPDSGAVTCDSVAGSFRDVCTYSCNSGYLLVGNVNRTCLGDSTWSHSNPAFCSLFDISKSFAVLQTPTPVVARTGALIPFSVLVRDDANFPVGTGSDLPLAYEVGNGPVNLVTATTYTGQVGNYSATFQVATQPGRYSYELGVNEQLFTSGPATLVPVNVIPGLVSPLFSSLVDANGDPAIEFNLETGALETFRLLLRDPYNNPIADAPDVARFSITFQRGIVSASGTQLALEGADVLTFGVLLGEGGRYTMSVKLDGTDVLNSPYIATVATTCLPGSRVDDNVRCTPCPKGSYSEERNAVVCTTCPSFTTTDGEGAGVYTNCTCLPTFWYGSGERSEGKGCVPCPPGGVCLGGNVPPRAAPGFEVGDTGEGVFVSCPNQAACAGDGRCAPGYTGRLCAKCADDYYRLGDTCRKCSGSNVAIFLVLVLLVFAFVTGVICINLNDSKVYGYAALVVAINTLQLIGLYGTIRIEWHPVAQALMDAISIANLNLDLTSPECGLDVGDVWMFKWGMTMALPLLFMIPFSIVTGVFVLVTKYSRETLLGAAGRGYIQAILVLFLPIMYTAVRYVDCTDVGNGIIVMTSNPQRRCYTSSWYALLPLILAVAAAYGLSIPLILGLFLRRKAGSLDAVTFAAKYAFLVARYKPELYLYELVILARKVAIVVTVCAFRSPTVKATMVALLLFAISCASLAARHRPYIAEYHNVMDAVTMQVSGALLWGGTIESSRLLRDILVVTSIFVLLGVLVVGVGYEVYRIRMQDEQDAQAYFDGKDGVNDMEFETLSREGNHFDSSVQLGVDDHVSEEVEIKLRTYSVFSDTDVDDQLDESVMVTLDPGLPPQLPDTVGSVDVH